MNKCRDQERSMSNAKYETINIANQRSI